MTPKDFIPQEKAQIISAGEFKSESPSNIALVKYWGKKENQIPANPSISFTLDHCKSTTRLKFSQKDENQKDKFSFEFYFEEEKKEDFKPKILKFFERIEQYCPYLKEYHFEISSSNSFPHSSGIASSASGMSAIALCIIQLEEKLYPEKTEEYYKKKASFLARLGSGSACRSLDGGLVVWGEHKGIDASSDYFGIPFPYKVHDIFKTYRDTILLVDKGEKQVSSTVGHNLMHGHPFAEKRFEQAGENLKKLIPVLESGDQEEFIKIVESEALSLHAMMMSSLPYFILIKPNTLEIINKIWEYRQKTNTPVCFTLDAGANVHLLYPEAQESKVLEFIKNELVVYCQNGHYICDRVGSGAKKL
ncbi:diphosphomevalonate/mevalonate 3,5-bisphosphate decarboxylase family protein [Christiangramia salexigens]|uniref:Diphosphomevalonate decarboxylase n=1 Tax=Christiangramia salexigens TaxID=1913577 RepID=A0A1L3J5V6_9FLAO|nr:diphosphomevalonate decarboxylase [Christiangramia salexigens]APG60529.1 diphosphomevalonate decarboxylase [Christiangramia salexigens]